jgi:hypothetical protein
MTQPDFAARNQVDVLLRERKDALTLRWLAATGGVGAIAVVLSIMANTIPNELPTAVVALVWIAGALIAILSVALPRNLLTDAQLAAFLRAPPDAYRWAIALKLKPEQKDAFLALPPQEQSVFALTLLFEKPYHLGLGLSLGVAGVGFAYGILTHTVLEAAPFLTAALALNCWHYPRLAPLVDRGRKLQAASQDEAEARALAELQQPQQPKEREGPRLRKSRTGERPTKA